MTVKRYGKLVVFQFTPLREGRQGRCDQRLPRGYFNSRPCERGDRSRAEWLAQYLQFQFTPLREGRLCLPVSL